MIHIGNEICFNFTKIQLICNKFLFNDRLFGVVDYQLEAAKPKGLITIILI